MCSVYIGLEPKPEMYFRPGLLDAISSHLEVCYPGRSSCPAPVKVCQHFSKVYNSAVMEEIATSRVQLGM